MPPVGFEPTIPAGERPQTYALERAATGTGVYEFSLGNISIVGHVSMAVWSWREIICRMRY
jgi:hypothetical protein